MWHFWVIWLDKLTQLGEQALWFMNAKLLICITSAQSNMVKGSIASLSPFATANGSSDLDSF